MPTYRMSRATYDAGIREVASSIYPDVRGTLRTNFAEFESVPHRGRPTFVRLTTTLEHGDLLAYFRAGEVTLLSEETHAVATPSPVNRYERDDDDDDDDDDYDDDGELVRRSLDDFVHYYSYRPTLRFLYDDGHGSEEAFAQYAAPGHERDLFMGFELETEYKDSYDRTSIIEIAEYATENFPNMVLKSDGSLTNGFEMVSQPATLEWYRNHQNWGGLEELARKGMRAWQNTNCGLHIHLSRAAFTLANGRVDERHMYAFTVMMYRNAQHFQGFAGRTSSYAQFSSGERRSAKLRVKGERNYERYVAVNFQNTHTIELRFFRPSLKPSTVIAALEMTHALWAYTKQLSVHDAFHNNGMDFPAFYAWVKAQGSAYTVLAARIAERLAPMLEGEDV